MLGSSVDGFGGVDVDVDNYFVVRFGGLLSDVDADLVLDKHGCCLQLCVTGSSCVDSVL